MARPGLPDSIRPTFRAVTIAVVPDARHLDACGWTELETIVQRALAARPRRLQRQLRLLVRALDWLSLLRWRRRFAALDGSRRQALLSALQEAPLVLLRRGIWGLRALVLMGYYGRAAAWAEIGYRPSLEGWKRP